MEGSKHMTRHSVGEGKLQLRSGALTILFATPVLALPPPPATTMCLSEITLIEYDGKSTLPTSLSLAGAMITVYTDAGTTPPASERLER